MGYSTTFRLKGELDDKFKSWMTTYKKSDESKYKVVLEAVCMKPFDGLEGKETWILHKVYDKVHSAVQFYVRLLVENWKVCIANRLKEKNNRISFYGWEFSSNRDCPWESEDDLVDYFTEDLFMLAINEANKPFGGKTNKDDEEWYEKWQKVKDTTNGIEESVTSFMDNQFIERYRDSEDADEDDGYEHRFPENEGKEWYDLDEESPLDEDDNDEESSEERSSDDDKENIDNKDSANIGKELTESISNDIKDFFKNVKIDEDNNADAGRKSVTIGTDNPNPYRVTLSDRLSSDNNLCADDEPLALATDPKSQKRSKKNDRGE